MLRVVNIFLLLLYVSHINGENPCCDYTVEFIIIQIMKANNKIHLRRLNNQETLLLFFLRDFHCWPLHTVILYSYHQKNVFNDY